MVAVLTPHTCARSDQPFESRKRDQAYCSLACKNNALTKLVLNNLLKMKFDDRVQKRQISISAVAREIGANAMTIHSWLTRSNHLFKAANLQRVAGWLNIDMETATRGQKGSAEEKLRDIAHAASIAPARLEHLERLKTDPDYRRQIVAPIIAATRGQTRSPESRQRHSEALKRYRQRPDAHRLGLHMKTPRGRAQALLLNRCRWHPDWDREQIETEAVRRILLYPHRYNARTEAEARALLTPKVQRKRSTRVHTSKTAERCRILHQLGSTWPRTASGRLADGFWNEAVRQVEAREGDSAPYHEELKVW
jgi:hypothetical protein